MSFLTFYCFTFWKEIMVKLCELPSSQSKVYLVLCLGFALGWSCLYSPDLVSTESLPEHFQGHWVWGPHESIHILTESIVDFGVSWLFSESVWPLGLDTVCLSCHVHGLFCIKKSVLCIINVILSILYYSSILRVIKVIKLIHTLKRMVMTILYAKQQKRHRCKE